MSVTTILVKEARLQGINIMGYCNCYLLLSSAGKISQWTLSPVSLHLRAETQYVRQQIACLRNITMPPVTRLMRERLSKPPQTSCLTTSLGPMASQTRSYQTEGPNLYQQFGRLFATDYELRPTYLLPSIRKLMGKRKGQIKILSSS